LAAIVDTKCNNRVFHQKYNFNTLKNEVSYTFLSIVKLLIMILYCNWIFFLIFTFTKPFLRRMKEKKMY